MARRLGRAVLVVLGLLSVSARSAEAGTISLGARSPSPGFQVTVTAATFSNPTCSGAPDSTSSHFIVGSGGAAFPLFFGESALLTAPSTPTNGGSDGQTVFVGWSSGAPHELRGTKRSICVPGFPGIDSRTYTVIYEPPPPPGPPPVPPPVCAGLTFEESSGSPLMGSQLVDLTVADVDHDGRLDLLTKGHGTPALGQGVEIRFGNGAGGFTPPLLLTLPTPVPQTSTSQAVPKAVDLNHDGLRDIVATFPHVSKVGVWLQQPGGGWGIGTAWPMDAFGALFPEGLAIADLNHDGHPDMITGNTAGGAVVVRLGNGSGGFGAIGGRFLPTGGDFVRPREVAVADFTGDGNPDVVAVIRNSSLYVLPGDGAGGLGAPLETLHAGAFTMDIADMNGDHRMDVVLGLSPSFFAQVLVFLNQGDGTFVPSDTALVAEGFSGVQIGDLTGDHRLDIAAALSGVPRVIVFAGDGTGEFEPRDELTSLAGPTAAVGIGDFNRDGRNDLAVTNNSDRIQVLLATCPNQPPTISATAITRQAGSIATDGQIATVSDDETPAGDIAVSVANVDVALTITNVINTGGIVTAEVGALCHGSGTRMFDFIATDGPGRSTTVQHAVTILPNTTPTIGGYGSLTLNLGEGAVIQASAAPGDNGLVTQAFASALGFTGTFTVDPFTGDVTVANAGPVGTHTVTVTVLDNCGAPAHATFTLTVRGLQPKLSWSPAAFTAVYTPLGPQHLNATADVPGTFVYSPGAGTVLPPGATTLHVAFTPASPDYEPASMSVTIEVLSLRQVKELLLAILRNLRAGVTHAGSAALMDDAIEATEASLDPALWLDGMTLTPGTTLPNSGFQVFASDALAVYNLVLVALNGQSGVPAQTLWSLMAGFLWVDRHLAVAQLPNIIDPVRRQQATEWLATGDREVSLGNYPLAILYYGVVWTAPYLPPPS